MVAPSPASACCAKAILRVRNGGLLLGWTSFDLVLLDVGHQACNVRPSHSTALAHCSLSAYSMVAAGGRRAQHSNRRSPGTPAWCAKQRTGLVVADQVRALVRGRNPAALESIPQSVKVIKGDIGDYDACLAAMDGVDKV